MDAPGEEVVADQLSGGMFLSSWGDAGRNQSVADSQGILGFGRDGISGKDVPLNLEKALANLASEVLHHSPPQGMEANRSSFGPQSVPSTAGMKQGAAASSFPAQTSGMSMNGYENTLRGDPSQNVGKMGGLSSAQMQILQNYMLQQQQQQKMVQLSHGIPSQGGMSLNSQQQQQQQRISPQYAHAQYQNVYAQQQQQQRILAGLHAQLQPNGVSGMMNRVAPPSSSGVQIYNAMLQQYGVSSSINNPYAVNAQASQMNGYGLTGMPQSSYGMNATNAGLHARMPMGQQSHARMNQLQSEALIAMQRQNSVGNNVQPNGTIPQNSAHAASQEVALQNQLVTMARNGMLTPEVMESLSRAGLGHAQVLAIVQRGMQLQSQQARAPQPMGAMNPPATAMNYMNSQPPLRPNKPESIGNGRIQPSIVNISGEKPSNPIQTLQDIGKTLSNLGISVEAAVNAGLLGGLSAADVRIVSDAHRMISDNKILEGDKSNLNSSMSNHIASYMKEHGSHLARSNSVPGNASAPAPGSPAGSVGGMSTASLPVHLNLAPTSPVEKKTTLEDDSLLDQLLESSNEQQGVVKNPVDEEWVKAKVESSMANFDAGQYGFFGVDDNQTGDGGIENGSIEDLSKSKQPSDAGSSEGARVSGCEDGEEDAGRVVEGKDQGGDRLSSYLAGLKLGTGF
jgi:hypothetical protein